VALTIGQDGSRTQELTYDPSTRQYRPIAIREEGEFFLLLFGTGIRGHSGDVVATVGGISVPVLAAVPQSEFIGLDQINVGPLPPHPEGKGLSGVIATVNEVPSNTIIIGFAE
jgi:hypothetical protein